MMHSRIASFLRATGFIALFLVGVECLLWFFGPALVSSVVRSKDQGYQYVPHITSARLNPESGYLLRLNTNAYGARDRHWTQRDLNKPMKVVVIGNSFVDAAEVPTRLRFTNLLERHLNETGRDALVMNFGVGGQNIINFLDRARYVLEAFQPDVLLIGLHDRSNFTHTEQVSFYKDQRYTLSSTAEGIAYSEVPLTPSEQQTRWIKSILRQSWLVRATFQAMHAVRVNVPEFKPSAEVKKCLLPFDTKRETSRRAFALTARIVDEIRALAGVRLMLLQIPGEDQVVNEISIPDCDLELPEKRLAEYAALRGIPLLQTLPLLRGSNSPTHFPGGHLNETGHKLIAEQLAASIAERY